MDIIVTDQLNGASIALSGRLDTLTAPELEKTLIGLLDNVTQVTFDLSGLSYLSSAGIRMLLFAHKKLAAKDGMLLIVNVPQPIKNVLEMSGLAEVFTIANISSAEKSSVYALNEEPASVDKALNGAEEFAAANGLERKNADTFRLLTEELVSLARGTISRACISLWFEHNAANYEIHLAAVTPVSVSEMNAFKALAEGDPSKLAPQSIRQKLAALFDRYVQANNEVSKNMFVSYDNFGNMMLVPNQDSDFSWSLKDYQNNARSLTSAEMDGVEKSIILRLASDVLVNVTSQRIDVILIKSF